MRKFRIGELLGLDVVENSIFDKYSVNPVVIESQSQKSEVKKDI